MCRLKLMGPPARVSGLQVGRSRTCLLTRRRMLSIMCIAERPTPQVLFHCAQRQVLAFYRTVLRQTRHQPAEQRGTIAAYARGEFERFVQPCILQCRKLTAPYSYHCLALSDPSVLRHRYKTASPKEYQLIEVGPSVGGGMLCGPCGTNICKGTHVRS